MKKILLTLLSVLLFTYVGLTQNQIYIGGDGYNFFYQKKSYLNKPEPINNKILQPNDAQKFYHFLYNGNEYVVGYDDIEQGLKFNRRNVYVFRWNGSGWVIASDVIREDFHIGYENSFHYPYKTHKTNNVVHIEGYIKNYNGFVEIGLLVFEKPHKTGFNNPLIPRLDCNFQVERYLLIMENNKFSVKRVTK